MTRIGGDGDDRPAEIQLGIGEPAILPPRDQRDRVWRSADDGSLSIDVGAIEKEPGGKAAATVFLKSLP